MTKARRVVTQFLAIGLASLLALPARANDAPLVADAHVVSSFPTVNFGAVSNLYVGNGSFALLQFDLSNLPSGTISAQVTRANLTLFVNRINVGGAVDVAAVQTGWTETGVTYNNWPTIGATATTVPVTTDTNNQRIRRIEYSALDFGNVPVGSTSAAKPITLSNSGTANVIVSSDQLTGTAFRIVSGGSCPATFPFTITPSTSCIINVVFSPAATTTYAEKNILTDNAPGSPQTVIATGVGVLNPTTLALTAQPSAPVYGDPVTILAKISETAAATVPLPTGQIAFTDASAPLGTQIVAQKSAGESQPLLPAGTHPISASYGGDSLYSSSTANLSLSVAKATPTISLVSTPAPVVDGKQALLTASVEFPASVPTGSVEFLDGTTVLGKVPLDAAGVATLNISALSTGSHTIDARYTGDSNFKSVTSADLGQVGGSFTLKASSASAAGTSETLTLTITPVNGFNQTVTLSCSLLPANSGCGFSPSSVPLDGTSAATASLTLTTQASCSNTGGTATFGQNGFLLPLLFFFGICSRRKRLRAFLFAGCLFLIGSGCAGQKLTCFTPSGSYMITVAGTSTVGTTPVTQTTTITISVSANGVIGSAVPQ